MAGAGMLRAGTDPMLPQSSSLPTLVLGWEGQEPTEGTESHLLLQALTCDPASPWGAGGNLDVSDETEVLPCLPRSLGQRDNIQARGLQVRS